MLITISAGEFIARLGHLVVYIRKRFRPRTCRRAPLFQAGRTHHRRGALDTSPNKGRKIRVALRSMPVRMKSAVKVCFILSYRFFTDFNSCFCSRMWTLRCHRNRRYVRRCGDIAVKLREAVTRADARTTVSKGFSLLVYIFEIYYYTRVIIK